MTIENMKKTIENMGEMKKTVKVEYDESSNEVVRQLVTEIEGPRNLMDKDTLVEVAYKLGMMQAEKNQLSVAEAKPDPAKNSLEEIKEDAPRNEPGTKDAMASELGASFADAYLLGVKHTEKNACMETIQKVAKRETEIDLAIDSMQKELFITSVDMAEVEANLFNCLEIFNKLKEVSIKTEQEAVEAWFEFKRVAPSIGVTLKLTLNKIGELPDKLDNLIDNHYTKARVRPLE